MADLAVSFPRLSTWGGEDDPVYSQGKAEGFTALLLIHLAFRRLFDVVVLGTGHAWPSALAALLFLLAAGPFVLRRFERARLPLLVLSLGCAGAAMVLEFPFGDNHSFAETLCLALACLCHVGTPDPKLLNSSLRCALALVFVHSGWQKVAHGAYFDGRYLAALAGMHENFAKVLPAHPLALAALSNVVYLSEIGVGALLLIPRTRRIGAVAALVLVAGIEVVAREVVFGLLCVNLALLGFRADWSRRLLPAFVAVYLVLLASAGGLLPEVVFK